MRERAYFDGEQVVREFHYIFSDQRAPLIRFRHLRTITRFGMPYETTVGLSARDWRNQGDLVRGFDFDGLVEVTVLLPQNEVPFKVYRRSIKLSCVEPG